MKSYSQVGYYSLIAILSFGIIAICLQGFPDVFNQITQLLDESIRQAEQHLASLN